MVLTWLPAIWQQNQIYSSDERVMNQVRVFVGIPYSLKLSPWATSEIPVWTMGVWGGELPEKQSSKVDASSKIKP